MCAIAVILGSFTVAVPSARATPTASGVTISLWNVQVFLPNIVSYPQAGYRFVNPTCTKGKPSSCPAKGTPISTTPLAGTVTNPHPVKALNTISCRQEATAVNCIALGVSPTGTPIIVETHDSGLRWSFGAVPSGVSALTAISCPTADRCFAAGAAGPNEYPDVLTSSNGGRSWSTVPIQGVAGFAKAPLDTISCPSATFCVTGSQSLVTNVKAGAFLAETPLVLVMGHGSDRFGLPLWSRMGSLCCQGSRWGGFAEPGLPAGVGAIACATVTLCWLLGSDDAGDLMFVESTNGGIRWQPVVGAIATPPGFRNFADGGAYLSCSNATHCWGQWQVADGLGGTQPVTPFATVDGRDWAYESPPTTVGSFAAVSCVTEFACTAAGAGIADSTNGGRTWSADVPETDLASVGSQSLTGVSCVASDQCWAVGAGNYGAFVIGTVATTAPSPLESSLPKCSAGSLPAIGSPCVPEFALSSLSVAPTCLSGAATDATPVSADKPRLEGESVSTSGASSLAGVWADLSVAPACRRATSGSSSSSIIWQDFDGSTYLQAGIRYLQPTPGRPEGADSFFVEFQDGGSGSTPSSYAVAGSGTDATPSGKEIPFTDVSWLEPLSGGSVGLGLVAKPAAGGTVDYSVDFNGSPAATTGPASFPFGLPVFGFTCGSSSAGTGGACAPPATGVPGPLDTVDLLNAASSASEMPGSCEVPMTFSSVHIDRQGWRPLPEPSVGAGTNGSSLAWDPKLDAWVVPRAGLQPSAPYLSHLALFAQDWAGSAPTSIHLPPSAWTVQVSATGTSTSITMQDQPCDTWAGVPPP